MWGGRRRAGGRHGRRRAGGEGGAGSGGAGGGERDACGRRSGAAGGRRRGRRGLELGQPDGVVSCGGGSFSVSRFVARTGEEAWVFIPRDL